ncbi:MAG: condensation domain-containing protein, partial [Byssovorax sp.]
MSTTTLEDSYALSPMQQGMLFHALYVAEPGVDVEQMVCAFREDLDVPAFERAWRRVVAEHAALRTAFRWQDVDEPRQEVWSAVDVTIRHHDLRGEPREAVDARLRQYLREDRRLGFDMGRPPLLRFALFRVAEAEYRFVWTFHHILLDGRSFPLVIRDVFACYEAYRAGAEPTFEARRPYKDFIGWLGDQESTADNAGEVFWRELLKGFRAPTPLLGARPAARQIEDIDYAEQTTLLSAETTAELAAAARRHKLTVNAFLQGAWALLLARYSGEPDVVFAATRACRRTALGGQGTDTMIGVFINTLPVRARLDPAADLVSWLRVIADQGRSVRAYEHTPLVKVRASSELPASAPMFETLFLFEERILDANLKSGGGAWENRDFRIVRQMNFPLSLVVYGGERLILELEYDKRRLDDAVIARMLGHLATVIEAMVADPTRRVGDIPLLTPPERQQILGAWNATARDFPRDKGAHQLFEAQADRTPDAVALAFEGREMSYRELDRRSNQLARHLGRRGVGPGALVGVAIERSLDLVIGLLGVLKAGAAYVPLDPTYPRDRIAFMASDAELPVLLTQESLAVEMAGLAPVAVRLDADWPEIAAESDARLTGAFEPESRAYVIYTSGSTGKPKGV